MSYTENKNIDGLEELTSLDDTDVLIAGDQSDADRAKKITKANLEADLDITASQVSDFDTEVANNSAVTANTAKNTYPSADATKLSGIEEGAEVNNINDTNATDLTDSGDSSLHYHSTDRARANHTGTQTASTISDFDTEVENNSAVALNTAKETNATHTGEVTGGGALTIADNVIDEAKLKVNSPTNDQVLTADSGEAGGMKWATPSSGFSDPMTTRGDIIYKNASNVTTRLGVGTNGQALMSDGTDLAWATPAGSGNVSTSGSPVDNDWARFVNATDIEGLSDTEMKTALSLTAGTDFYSKTAEDTWRNSTTETEMGYLHGVTSDIQTQLNTKGDMNDVVDDTTPQLGGNLDCNGKNLTDVQETRLDGTPDTDHTATGNTTETFNAGESITIMDCVRLHSDGEWHKTDADAEATAVGMLGIALEAKTDGQAMKVAIANSFVRDDTFDFTPGQVLYLSETAGAITPTAPTTTDAVVRIIGHAVSADVIFFNPDNTYIKHS